MAISVGKASKLLPDYLFHLILVRGFSSQHEITLTSLNLNTTYDRHTFNCSYFSCIIAKNMAIPAITNHIISKLLTLFSLNSTLRTVVPYKSQKKVEPAIITFYMNNHPVHMGRSNLIHHQQVLFCEQK
jgi:hypothetical protein